MELRTPGTRHSVVRIDSVLFSGLSHGDCPPRLATGVVRREAVVVLWTPIATEVSMLITSFVGGVCAKLLNYWKDLLVVRAANSATIAVVILHIDNDESCDFLFLGLSHFVSFSKLL